MTMDTSMKNFPLAQTQAKDQSSQSHERAPRVSKGHEYDRLDVHRKKG